METYYTGVSAATLKQLQELKQLVPAPIDSLPGVGQIILSEDMAYWVEILKNQEDQPTIEAYEYAHILEVVLKPGVVSGLLTDPKTGRVSDSVHEIMQRAQKPPIQVDDQMEAEVAVLTDIRASDEGVANDGLSQTYKIRCLVEGSAILDALNDGTQRISQVASVK